ncbi:23S rRNA (guanosine(2251)-2'-O)-methyltransferase RlmB [Deinococcus multiflagellatus]|uniref:23S rRNA (guanosine(2251)-2'-O)-methyltransferase RlmB n=1 Tax=Deinococcus multiflagellatus TaxID=1656887 RepID=UPI001CCE0A8F|nr:23S rRNA (guanosine(2251)-2'-O)-methyltransferase RlmB [Deinococcus multiflagellatus]MBZ9712516.1 23S rRNA (guanosine(2251)-2'-O)-methyltransferase RlmB [Deinococcus multiflagellatus]
MLLYGRNPVLEALREGRVSEVLVARGVEEALVAQLKATGVRLRFAPRIELDQLAGTTAHQGLLAEVEDLAWGSVDDILDLAEQRGEDLLIVLLDGITDPRNFGAIIRSAEVLGAHGVVVEERRSAPLSPVVAKTAAGATSYLPVAQTKNLPRLIEALKKEGVWVYGAAGEAAQDVRQLDFSGKVALVIGAEGEGMRRLVREKCDALVSIPVRGRVQSLNASVAAGILLFEITRGRA